ncbi:hypothetical protein [Clostridium hydrogenum]|uniref:hypothetical protein n=1 Tax=Clostridium hydrogenum TaxID=2855764 RepID=UPI001F459C44|nr:hypothetical protein [Clostridium hydrogenum]
MEPPLIVIDCEITKEINKKFDVAFAGEYCETVGIFLEAWNTNCTNHYSDLLDATISKYTEQLSNTN